MDKYRKYTPPQFSTIESAVQGDILAINAILKHYERYIGTFSIRNSSFDDVMRQTIENRLIKAMFSFKIEGYEKKQR